MTPPSSVIQRFKSKGHFPKNEIKKKRKSGNKSKYQPSIDYPTQTNNVQKPNQPKHHGSNSKTFGIRYLSVHFYWFYIYNSLFFLNYLAHFVFSWLIAIINWPNFYTIFLSIDYMYSRLTNIDLFLQLHFTIAITTPILHNRADMKHPYLSSSHRQMLNKVILSTHRRDVIHDTESAA